MERRLEACGLNAREIENDCSAVREQTAALQTKIESQTARQAELQQEIALIRQQLATMDSHGDGAADAFRNAAQELLDAETELQTITGDCHVQTAQADMARADADAALVQHEQLRAKLEEYVRTAAFANEQIASLESEVLEAEAAFGRCRKRLAELAQRREYQRAEVDRDQKIEAELVASAELHRSALSAAERKLAEVRRDLARADAQYRQLDGQLTRVRERIAVLSELESRLEGLDGGVQEILRLAREQQSHHLGDVRGVVADLFHVDVDSAPLVEVALGERAQFIVLASTATLIEWLQSQPLRVAGRVGFLGLDGRYSLTALDHVDLTAEPGVMGRADRFIESASDYQSLARRLLGRTWLVDRMATALRLAQSIGRGLDFVTSDGELISAEGTVVVGPRQAATGVLSRRSELRACHVQANELEVKRAAQAAITAQLENERTRQEELVASSVAAYTAAAGKLTECHRQTAAASSLLDRIIEDEDRVAAEMRENHERVAANRAEIEKHGRDCQAIETQASQVERALDEIQTTLADRRQHHSELIAIVTDRKIALARCEQRVEMLRQQLEQAQRSQQERDQLLMESRDRLANRESQFVELEDALLRGRQSLAELFLTKEQIRGPARRADYRRPTTFEPHGRQSSTASAINANNWRRCKTSITNLRLPPLGFVTSDKHLPTACATTTPSTWKVRPENRKRQRTGVTVKRDAGRTGNRRASRPNQQYRRNQSRSARRAGTT